MLQLRLASLFGCLALLCATAAAAAAQDRQPPSSFGSIVSAVVRDPSVYAPAAAKYSSMQLDWSSSQVFFEHGFIERNPTFTLSGRPLDKAIGYGAGNRKVAMRAGLLLGVSMSGNLGERSLETLLVRRFESRRKLIRMTGHALRFAGASYLSYSTSIGHFRQWRRNEQLAAKLGYK